MSVQLYRKTMIPMLERKIPTAGFLTSFFQTPSGNIKNSPSVKVEVKRNKAMYAVDIKAGRGVRYNKRDVYTDKEYFVPAYKEGFMLIAEDLQMKPIGVDEYTASQKTYLTQALEQIGEDMDTVVNKIKYATEKQSRDVFYNGKIVLQNDLNGSDEIDFKKKATHNVVPAVKWDNVSGDPVKDITALCQVVRTDSMINTSSFDMTVDDATLNAMLDNQKFQDRANLRRMDLVNINMPQGMNPEGATFHGVFSAGSNTIYLWTYNATYTIPEGFGFANEGTVESFVPAQSGLLIARGARFDLVYAGMPRLYSPSDGSVSMPTVQTGKMLPFVYEDKENEAIKYGVESRPLCIPTEIDAFGTFASVLT